MVQSKKSRKTRKKQVKTLPATKPTTAVQPLKMNPMPVIIQRETVRTVNAPVLSFILFVVALIIWFFVGSLFMQLAVRENFCHIRYTEQPKIVGEVIAVIDGENVYLSEMQSYANSIPQLKDIPFEAVYPQLLDMFINARVLQRAAELAGIEARPEVQQALQVAHDQIVAQAYLDSRLKEMATDKRLRDLYAKEMADFKPVTEIHARHILLKTKEEAQDVLAQLKAGADFASLANKYSLDKSSPAGDLGYFTEEMMIPEFSRAVFALKKGQLSKPIQTAFGWHVVQVEDRRQTQQPTFEEVRDDLMHILMEQDVESVLKQERQKLNVHVRKINH